tara:strand:- start:6501 stop:7724 length:1224 start_codon:yes stop_codon:yes gene_type:complete
MKTKFLDLGKQPIANDFIPGEEYESERYSFDLGVVYDDETHLVSLSEFVPPEKMFNENYVYHSSYSQTMRDHFKNLADTCSERFNPLTVLEIGSNDGVFLNHWGNDYTIGVEPCSNFAEITEELGYKTYPKFWNTELSNEIKESFENGFDLISASNCICHIQDLDDCFTAVHNLLSDRGVFVFEDPSLIETMKRNSYDQFYDEHAHIFSVTALEKLLERNGLFLFDVEPLSVHGGSNRIFASKTETEKTDRMKEILKDESDYGLDKLSTYEEFAKRVEKSKEDLFNILKQFNERGYKVISYGATSKSTTVFNYCGIDDYLIQYITDTTEDKQGKYSPGVKLPVVSPEEGFDDEVDVAFLGAWNFEKEIREKESDYEKSGGLWITHVPEVRVLGHKDFVHEPWVELDE